MQLGTLCHCREQNTLLSLLSNSQLSSKLYELLACLLLEEDLSFWLELESFQLLSKDSVAEVGSTTILHQILGPNCSPLCDSLQWEVYVPSILGATNSTETVPTCPDGRDGTNTSFFSEDAKVKFPHISFSWNTRQKKQKLTSLVSLWSVWSKEHFKFCWKALHRCEAEKSGC